MATDLLLSLITDFRWTSSSQLAKQSCMADAVEGAIKMIIDLSFIFILFIAVLSQSQTTSDAHAQWRRLRLNDTHGAMKVKRQAMGNAAGGVQVPMSSPMQPTGPQHQQPTMTGPSGPGMGGSPQFMGPHGIHHEFSCIGRLPRLYQDPWQCNRYYWCNYGSPPVPFSCPGGQLFDQELQSCTMALAVECRDFPEPLDALDMPAGGIGYGGHFGGMNGSPYSAGGGMGMAGPMVNVAGGGGLGPAVSGPMVVNSVMPPPPPLPPPLPQPAQSGSSNNMQQTPPQVVMSSPMNSAPQSNVMPTMANINNMVQAAQAASLQGSGGMLSNNINLNQFANALLSAGHSQSSSQQHSPDTSAACDGGKLGLFADTGKHCRTYFFCSPGGTKYEFQCTPPLLFSDRIKTCDNPENVVCDGPSPGAGNQVVNGFAVNSPARGMGFAGVISAAPDNEAMPLRFPFQQHTSNHLVGNGGNLYAMQSVGMKRQQAMQGGLQPDFMQASSNSYPNYAMQQGTGGPPPPPSYHPYGARSGGLPSNGMNPYAVHPMYGQSPFTTGGSSQLPHHLSQRSMQPTGVPSQYTPSVYPTYQTQPDPVNSYPMNGPPASMYPSPVYGRPPVNPAAEPMEGSAANYPSHLPSPTYYPMSAQPPPHHQPQQQPAYHQAPHYGGRGAAMGVPVHGGGGGGVGGGVPHAGPRGMKIPMYDPEAEVEAGRGAEPGAAGGPPPPGGGPPGGPGPGQPAGLNSYPQSQVGPMVMHPDVLLVEGTFPPSEQQDVVVGSTSPVTVTTSAGGATSPQPTAHMATSATVRPMSPDIILPLNLLADTGGLTQKTAYPVKSEVTSNAVPTIPFSKSDVIVSAT